MQNTWFGTNLEKSIQTPSTGKKYLESDLTVDFAKFSLFLFLKIDSLQMIEGAIFSSWLINAPDNFEEWGMVKLGVK